MALKRLKLEIGLAGPGSPTMRHPISDAFHQWRFLGNSERALVSLDSSRFESQDDCMEVESDP